LASSTNDSEVCTYTYANASIRGLQKDSAIAAGTTSSHF